MAGEALYYIFSLIIFLGIALYLINLILIRTRGGTTFGLSFKPGTAEHKRVVKLASNRSIAITAVLGLVLMTNLAYDVNRLLHLDDYSRSFLISVTIFTLAMFALLIPYGRKIAKDVRNLDRGKSRK